MRKFLGWWLASLPSLLRSPTFPRGGSGEWLCWYVGGWATPSAPSGQLPLRRSLLVSVALFMLVASDLFVLLGASPRAQVAAF